MLPALPQVSSPSRLPVPGSDTSSRLALELALRIKPADQVADEYGLTKQELAHRLQHDEDFKGLVKTLRDAWQHPMAAAERVRLKAAVLAEDGLVEVWSLLTDPDLNPSVRLDAHKHLAKLADVEPKRDGPGTGPQFSLTLNLGGDKEQLTIQAEQADDDLIEDAA